MRSLDSVTLGICTVGTCLADDVVGFFDTLALVLGTGTVARLFTDAFVGLGGGAREMNLMGLNGFAET